MDQTGFDTKIGTAVVIIYTYYTAVLLVRSRDRDRLNEEESWEIQGLLAANLVELMTVAVSWAVLWAVGRK